MKPELRVIKTPKVMDDGVREIDLEKAYEMYFPDFDDPHYYDDDDKNRLKIVA